MMSVDGQVSETELNDLRSKFQLLSGDRQAYYEMSMVTMKENKKLIASLRDGNKAHRKKLASLQKQARSNSRADGEIASDKEINNMEKHVMTLRKNFDTLKDTVEGRRQELRRLRDQATALELEAKRPTEEETPETRKIRALENRLDKSIIKYNEAQSIRTTYEQIVKRLKEERVSFDVQLQAIERTLKAKERDYEELLLLSGDASHAKDVALQDLEKSRSSLTDARKQRERDLRAKQELVSVKNDVVSRLEKREQMRNDIIAKVNGDLSEQEEKNLKATVALNTFTQTRVAEDSKNQKEKIGIFEEAFQKIKASTGVSDVNEVIQKLISQESTTRNLNDLTRENQQRLETLQAEKQKLLARVEEIKYSGASGGNRRKFVDEHEERLAHAIAKLERARVRYERLAKILISVKAGISHLSDKLEGVQQDNKHIVLNDDTVVDVLVACENTLCSILGRINQDSDPEAQQQMCAALLDAFDDQEVVASRPFNQRVMLPDHSDDNLGPHGRAGALLLEGKNADADSDTDSIDVPLDDDGEEELTRDRIKKASQTIISTHEKKAKRKQQRKANGTSSAAVPTSTSLAPNKTSRRIGKHAS
ncbi:Coiled-coil domain-containing protein 151 [Hondaea fermentalgiana]|uniref:Coiled-coil domain-containing protein 151 n=1 Tax=Hondaea fermentalgiana TaxID=2315210 RepID=A0A2R5GZY7_9STRA|nr:Coiled-coil domain-containing protein 151 [Hondaea fermentalgiana]|eukprot:GBG34041.1 Coiled-coil domain-containing protein 151 [Hondaea fermentalgiana]